MRTLIKMSKRAMKKAMVPVQRKSLTVMKDLGRMLGNRMVTTTTTKTTIAAAAVAIKMMTTATTTATMTTAMTTAMMTPLPSRLQILRNARRTENHWLRRVSLGKSGGVRTPP